MELKSLYYVQCDNDATVLVALEPVLTGNILRWFDTVKERSMTIGEILDSSPGHFIFRRQGEPERTYIFVPLTVDNYNSHVKSKLIHGRHVTTDEELRAAFEETKREAW